MRTRTLATCRAAKLVSAALTAAAAPTYAAAMPVLPEPSALAGTWLLSDGSGRPPCRVNLDAAPVPGGWRLTSERACLQRIAPAVAAWRPEPDGVAFAATDRRTLAFFARTGTGGYAHVRPEGAKLELVREAAERPQD